MKNTEEKLYICKYVKKYGIILDYNVILFIYEVTVKY